MEDGSHLVLLAQNPQGYANLCRLLTAAHLHEQRLPWQMLERFTQSLICLSGCSQGLIPRLLLAHRYAEAERIAIRLREIFGPERFFIELQNLLLPKTKC